MGGLGDEVERERGGDDRNVASEAAEGLRRGVGRCGDGKMEVRVVDGVVDRHGDIARVDTPGADTGRVRAHGGLLLNGTARGLVLG